MPDLEPLNYRPPERRTDFYWWDVTMTVLAILMVVGVVVVYWIISRIDI